MTSECHEHDAMRVLLGYEKSKVCAKKHCLNVILDVQGHVHAFPVSFQKSIRRVIHLAVLRALSCQMTGIWCDRCVMPAHLAL